VLLGLGFVRSVVLADDTYRSALVRVDAYERAYTDVLADPALNNLYEQLLGRVTPAASNPEVRSLSTGALRWTLPPSRLREGTEYAVSEALEYVRGDSPRLNGAVTIADVVDRVPETAVAVVRSVLADAAEAVAVTLVGYDQSVQDFVAELSEGRIPSSVPVYGGRTINVDRLVEIIVSAFGGQLDAQTRSLVSSALYADDDRSALIAAATVLVADFAQEATDQLRDASISARDIDVIAEIADRAGVAPQRVVDEFNGLRSLAAWTSWPTGLVAALAVVVGAALVGWSFDDRRRRWATLALSIAGGGLAFWVLSLLLPTMIGSPLAPAIADGPGSWRLPAALRRLVEDVSVDVTQQFRRRAAGMAMAAVTVGLVGAAAVLLPQRRAVLTIRRVAIGAGVAAAASVAVWVVTLGPRSVSAEPTCNGSAHLCERRYDEVVYAATHNAMSSPDIVYFWPEQDHSLRTQLDSGVRALLIDTHYWPALASDEELASLDPLMTPALANRLYAVLGRLREERDGVYLCHAHCALGAIELVDALREVGRFLDDNPGEVVTLIVQNGVSTSDTGAAFLDAGLDDLLHVQGEGDEWPTLGDMVESGRRLVVFSEFQELDSSPPDSTPPDWYHAAYDWLQDTPFQYRSPSQFNCALGRGSPENSLLLVNHWIRRAAPDRADAAAANQRGVIIDRAEKCMAERGLMPNFIAVNFSNVGDLTATVDELNQWPLPDDE
jgi:hypothetical protein